MTCMLCMSVGMTARVMPISSQDVRQSPYVTTVELLQYEYSISGRDRGYGSCFFFTIDSVLSHNNVP